MDRNLALEFVRVTEAAAIAAARWVGKGEGKLADAAAVDAMRARFNSIDFKAEVVIGEGAKDEAPELYVGEKLGSGKGPEMDIAVDPLEATDSVAYGRTNSIAVIAAGPKGSLLRAPDVYMEKIAVGPQAKGAVRLGASVKENIAMVAQYMGKPVGEVTVVILDRPQHINGVLKEPGDIVLVEPPLPDAEHKYLDSHLPEKVVLLPPFSRRKIIKNLVRMSGIV